MPESRQLPIKKMIDAIRQGRLPPVVEHKGYLRDLGLALTAMMETYAEDRRQWSELEKFYDKTTYLSSEEESLLAGRDLVRNLIPSDSGAFLLAEETEEWLIPSLTWGNGQGDAFVTLTAEAGSDDSKASNQAMNLCPAIWGSQTFQGGGCNCFPNQGATHTVCAPLLSLGYPLGILRLVRNANQPFSSVEVELASKLATSIGAVLSNYRLLTSIRNQAMTDPLTGLYNHRFLEEYLDKQLADGERNGAVFSLLLLDIDHFKQLNDTYGHESGNIVLRGFVEVVKASVRPSDVVARWGGEEFIVLLPRAEMVGAMVVAERIRRNVEQWHTKSTEGDEVNVTVSIGVAAYPLHGRNRFQLFEKADLALYEAKANGRNQSRSIPSDPGGESLRDFLAN